MMGRVRRRQCAGGRRDTGGWAAAGQGRQARARAHGKGARAVGPQPTARACTAATVPCRAVVPALHKKYLAAMVNMFGECAEHGARVIEQSAKVRVDGAGAGPDVRRAGGVGLARRAGICRAWAGMLEQAASEGVSTQQWGGLCALPHGVARAAPPTLCFHPSPLPSSIGAAPPHPGACRPARR